MKRILISLTIGYCLGYCSANYHFNAQSIYEDGVRDGYNLQRQHVLFTSNHSYQRGWEDCFQALRKKKLK